MKGSESRVPYFRSKVHNKHAVLAITDAALGQLYNSANSPKHDPLWYVVTATSSPTHADAVPE